MASSFTAAEIVALRAPSYASDSRLSDLITLSTEQTSRTNFGDRLQTAIALRVMHWLALDEQGRAGAGGAVASVKTGDLSMTFASAGSGLGDLGQTQYGIELKQLIRMCCLGARTTSSYY